MHTESPDPLRHSFRIAVALTVIAVAIAPINFLVYVAALDEHGVDGFNAFFCLAIMQSFIGLLALVAGIVHWVRSSRASRSIAAGIVTTVFGGLAALGGVGGLVLGFLGLAVAAGGGAWGRPLRIRGRVRHPELRRGEDWTRGARPDATGLDADTRAALEALWLHDAQKEHASVPAFARVAWMLTAVGASAELLERTLRAAAEELEHTRLCFALAAGYGGRTHAVLPMPELLLDGALEVRGNALVHLLTESVKDGCLLEDYNADVAAACARVCREPVTRDVLERIAVEERSHAELSWSIVEFCLARGGTDVRASLLDARDALVRYERPTAVAGDKRALVERADPTQMRAHGRLPDAEWAAIYAQTLERTVARIDLLLERRALAA